MKTFKVSVPYCVNYVFTVEAETEEEAIAMVDEDNGGEQEMEYDEEWQGIDDMRSTEAEEVE